MPTQKGLTSQEAELRLEKFGLNNVVEKKGNFFRKYIVPLYSPISLMLIAAAVLSRLNGRIFDFYFILALYAVNYSIQKWQEFKADSAIKELQNRLDFDISVLRDGRWVFVKAKHLVPGDRIRLGLGSMIPADAVVENCNNLSVNEAVLTGESMPKEKKIGDLVYSGAFISAGNMEAELKATGRNTLFGKTIFSIEASAGRSLLENDIISISRFLTYISVGAVIVLSAVFVLRGVPFDDLLTLDLSLVIAGIPVALPAVMAIILSIGAGELAKKLVIVRRLSALEDLSNVNLLLTDKTGTLTKNEIGVASLISYASNLSTGELIEIAALTAGSETPDAIDLAILGKYEEMGRPASEYKVVSYIPYDSDRKRSTAICEKAGSRLCVSVGAPQVIEALCAPFKSEFEKKFEADIETAASQGFRTLAVGINREGSEEIDLELIGLVYLSDPLDESSKETIRFMAQNGIGVKMLTGDNLVITQRIAHELQLGGPIIPASEIRSKFGSSEFEVEYQDTAAFAEILPKDKYEIVKAFKNSHIVASTGDGINDLPALRVANVGIAVSGAVSALRSMADIVLLGRGIGVIRDAVIESRKIFVRLYNYSVYRISESFRLIITILILGIWFGNYPLEPLQIILLAFLNDIPIITLAVDRVKIAPKPASLDVKERTILSILFGGVGILNSLVLFYILTYLVKLPIGIVQTIFFLKLTVSGHALIFVAHTKERWYRFLPSKEVIFATLGTQILATGLAVSGLMMPAKISLGYVALVWVWALFWMQISELMKIIKAKYL